MTSGTMFLVRINLGDLKYQVPFQELKKQGLLERWCRLANTWKEMKRKALDCLTLYIPACCMLYKLW